MGELRVRDLSVWGLVAGGAFVCAATVLQSCSSPFSDCVSARDCASGNAGEGGEPAASGGSSGASLGSAGMNGGEATGGAAMGEAGEGGEGGALNPSETAGASGEAGAGGAAPIPECVHDADCSDHLACNGTETCVEGKCNPGSAPCANPDAVHCDVLCAELNGAASCTVRGVDKDKDGHYSSACAAQPGDDCNDSIATIYTGAPEICDQLDNNCNGKIDVEDGVPPSGKDFEIGQTGITRSTPKIAWAPTLSAYGVAYAQAPAGGSGTWDVYMEEVDPAGKVTLMPTKITTSGNGPSEADLSFAWGGDAFAASWGGLTGRFQIVSSSGTLPSPAVAIGGPIGGPPQIAKPNTSWLLLFAQTVIGQGTFNIGLDAVTPAGAAGTTSPVTTDRNVPTLLLTSAGANYLLGIDDDSHGLSTSLFDGTSGALLHDLGHLIAPVAGGGTAGFAVVSETTATSAAFSASLYNAAGTQLCGPVSLPAGFHPTSIVATSTRYVVMSTDLRFQEVSAACKLGISFALEGAAPSVSNPQLSGGAAGFGIAWQDTSTNTPKMRLIGPHYCDASALPAKN